MCLINGWPLHNTYIYPSSINPAFDLPKLICLYLWTKVSIVLIPVEIKNNNINNNCNWKRCQTFEHLKLSKPQIAWYTVGTSRCFHLSQTICSLFIPAGLFTLAYVSHKNCVIQLGGLFSTETKEGYQGMEITDK